MNTYFVKANKVRFHLLKCVFFFTKRKTPVSCILSIVLNKHLFDSNSKKSSVPLKIKEH